MTRLALLIALCVSLSACSAEDATPTSPGTALPSTTVFTLSGTVVGYDGPLPGASVTIMDGIHAGQTGTTDNAGKFSFTDLSPSAFTLSAAPMPIDGYLTQNQSVNLTTADQSVIFRLQDH